MRQRIWVVAFLCALLVSVPCLSACSSQGDVSQDGSSAAEESSPPAVEEASEQVPMIGSVPLLQGEFVFGTNSKKAIVIRGNSLEYYRVVGSPIAGTIVDAYVDGTTYVYTAENLQLVDGRSGIPTDDSDPDRIKGLKVYVPIGLKDGDPTGWIGTTTVQATGDQAEMYGGAQYIENFVGFELSEDGIVSDYVFLEGRETPEFSLTDLKGLANEALKQRSAQWTVSDGTVSADLEGSEFSITVKEAE